MTAVPRTEDIQKGIDDYLELHKDQIAEIYSLEPVAREKEFSSLLDKELDYISIMGKQNPKRERDTQIMVAMETDRILELDSSQQQIVIKSKYGLSPKEVIDHYPELQDKAKQLETKLKKADKITTAVGWSTMGLTAAAMLVKFGKGARSLGDKISNDNKFIKWFVVPFTSIAAGFAGSLIATGLFGNVRQDSQQLVYRTRNILENEVADAVDSRIREAIAAKTAMHDSKGPEAKAADERKFRVVARENFTAEAMKDKSVAQAPAELAR
jgi:hypothetical protein